MPPYVFVPLLSCLLSAVIATAIFARDPRVLANRLAAGLVASGSFWALCEVLWNLQTDPSAVLFWVRASAFGWAAIGPLALHLFLELTGGQTPGVRRALPTLYAASGVFLLVDWFTPWLHTGVARESWGWSYSLGPVYPLFYAFTLACIGLALVTGWRTVHGPEAGGERDQARWLSLGILCPLVVASTTDGVLPFLGIQVPRLGTASLTALGAMVLWTFHRYGYSLLAPGAFAREILETLPDGVAMVRLDGRVRSANGALARLMGARPEDLAGLRLTDHLTEPLHPTEEAIERRCDLITLRGDHVPVAVSSRVLLDRQDSAIGLAVVVRDLDEVVSLRDRLMLSGRLAAVGELAAGIAHEINNPLAFVRSNLSLLRQHWGQLGGDLQKAGLSQEAAQALAEGEEAIDESLEGVDRASAIVRDVRGLAHGGKRERSAADLRVLLEGVLRIAAPQLRTKATVETRFTEVPPVWGSPQELQQVFLNLVLNAAQAIEEHGVIRVSTEVQGRFSVVHVEDDGSGIDPEIRDRIFDPFFTTKPVGEGTGLGLGIVHNIVGSHGGDIVVDSVHGRGTRFSVHLPTHTDTIEAS